MHEGSSARVGLALWGTESVQATAEHARAAEAAGFESIWLVDSQLICRELYVTLWVYVGLDRDEARARKQVLARVAAVLRMSDPARFEGSDREDVERLHRDYDMFAHAQSTPRHAALVPERFIDRYAVAGTPQQVRDRLAALLGDARVQRLVVSPQIGAPGTRITRDFIDLFADAVLTEVRRS